MCLIHVLLNHIFMEIQKRHSFYNLFFKFLISVVLILFFFCGQIKHSRIVKVDTSGINFQHVYESFSIVEP